MRHALVPLVIISLYGFLSNGTAAESTAQAIDRSAYYVVSTSEEHEAPPVHEISVRITGTQRQDGNDLTWWEMAARTRTGESFGLRMLSERPGMTSPAGIGRVARYIYRDATGKVLEYVDESSGQALLPPIQFVESFLPRPSADARYDAGFASAGALLGHVLTEAHPVAEVPQLDFTNPRVLRLRPDLLIGAQATVVAERVKPEGNDFKDRPCTRAEIEDLMRSGFNYFDASHIEQQWLWCEPVFFRMAPRFPDTYYRSNWIPGGMFIDEPSVRLGWSGGIPSNPTGPEQVAEAMRQRVKALLALPRRIFPPVSGEDRGTLELVCPRAPSWDTDYYSAWYQMEAGARGLVHEGRYVKRGYGWEPEELYGAEGLEGLTFQDQLNGIYSILRGAARAFDGDWGTSVYPEGDPDLRLPALCRAYDMGARNIWFWTYPPLTYAIEKELAAGLMKHVREHPRGTLRSAMRAGQVGIVLPRGYVFSWAGTWGMQREQRSGAGASYGDVSAAAMWEAILCSRRGIACDMLIDEERITHLGYERLIYVREDGSLDPQPAWAENRAPGKLTVACKSAPIVQIAGRDDGHGDHTVQRTQSVVVDGRLDEWPADTFIKLDCRTHGFPDVVSLATNVVNDLSNPEWRLKITTWMGMSYTQIDEALENKYALEDSGGRGVIITKLDPDSPAAKAGILEGDVITGVLTWPTDWLFQVPLRLEAYRNGHDGELVPVRLRRSGRYTFGGPADLAARVAVLVDNDCLYLAADVVDDTHNQPHAWLDLWKGDSVQIGLDPTLEQRDGTYGEEDTEIALALQDARAAVWRYHGRRGQPVGRIASANVRIARAAGHTVYEAAIPLTELSPVSPDLWPAVGIDMVVNDSDGSSARKGRLELRPKAMTLGKKTREFPRFRFAPSDQPAKVSAALLWKRRATPENGSFRLILAVRSPKASRARVNVMLRSLDTPNAPATGSSIDVPVTTEAIEHSLIITTDSPPGRYDLELSVSDPQGRVVTRDHLPVYIYPTGK